MNKLLLDSTILVDFLRGKNKAIEFIETHKKDTILFTSEISVFELMVGAHLYENKEKHLEKVIELISQIEVLPLDRQASIKAGEIAGMLLRRGNKIESTDSLIAGIALTNGIHEIVTKNEKHFGRIQDIKIIVY